MSALLVDISLNMFKQPSNILNPEPSIKFQKILLFYRVFIYLFIYLIILFCLQFISLKCIVQFKGFPGGESGGDVNFSKKITKSHVSNVIQLVLHG